MEWFDAHAWQAWLGLAFTLGVLEMLSLDLILLMLSMGAVVAMVGALVGLPVAIQVLAFAGASAAMLLLVRPGIARRLHGGPELRLGASKLIGMQGVVTTRITGAQPGRITVDGEDWSARPLDETLVIPEGDAVDVLRIEGATAYVHPVPKLEP